MPTTLKRTTIFLTPEQHEKLRRLAFEQRTSMASLIRDMAIKVLEDREAVRERLTQGRIIETLKKQGDALKKYHVKRIGLFGSYVRGEQRNNSDIDFLVDFDMAAFGENFKGYHHNFVELAAYLENVFGKKVDLLTQDSISPYIEPYVEKEVRWYEG